MATTTERLELLITAKAKDAVDGLKQTDQSIGGLGGKVKALDDKFAGLNSKMQSVGLQGVSTGTLLAGGLAVGAAALAGLVHWTAEGVQKQLELADAVRGVRDITGLTAEDASRLVEVTGDYGVEIGTVQSAMFKLSDTVQNSRDKFAQHDIEVKKNKDGSVDLLGTLENVQKAYLKSGDATERNAILMDLFGRRGKELIPVLTETKDLSEALADVPESRLLSDEDIESARQYQLAMDDLGDAMDAFQRLLGGAVIPQLAQYIAMLNQVLELGLKVPEVASKFGAIGSALTESFIEAAPVIGPTVGLVKDLGGALGFGKGESDAFADAQKRLAEAHKDVARLATDETAKQSELREAKKELSAAQSDLEIKTRAVADALQDENDKTAESINLAYQRLGGILGVYGADLQYQRALDDRAVKQANLTRLEAEGKQGTEEYARAKRDLEQADLALVQAALGLEGQITALQAEVDAGTISNEEYQRRIEDLKAKYPELGAAIDVITWKVGVHRGAIESVPDGKHTRFTADADDAHWVIDRLKEKIRSVPNSVSTTLRAVADAVGAEGAIVNRPTVALIGEAGPEMLVPLHKMPGNQALPSRISGGGVGGNSYAISVSVAPGGSPADTGRAVVEAIKEYERRAGSSWRN